MRTVRPNVLSLITLLLLSAGICRADGLIVIHDAPPSVPGHFAFAPLQVTYHHVSVNIEDQVAVTSVDQEFFNPNNQRLEGTYLFPLPSGSHIDHFVMDINGVMTPAELLPADKARSLYEEIVRKYRDPALLEYMGRDAFRVRIFPIEPHSTKHIKLQYTQLLNSDSGAVEYTYPLNTEKFSSAPLREVSVKVELSCKQPLKSIYSPTHDVKILRQGEHAVSVIYEQNSIRPDTYFKLIFTRTPNPVGIDLLTYRSAADKGFFLLLASPGLTAPHGQIEKKDVCFVLDTSGSMAGVKIEQAKKALSFCLNSLNEGDRFEVVRFSTDVEPLFGELRSSNKSNTAKALAFVKELQATGGTNISTALQQTLNLRPAGRENARPYVIVFLTDGEPTVGDTNEDSIVSTVDRISGGRTKIFCFGVGNDVNTHLLDRIAEQTRALSTYVRPEEDIEVKVSSLYEKIREPVLSNVNLAFGSENVHVSQVYPPQMPDLYKGQMLVAFGRYSGHGAAAAKITGTFNGQPQQFASELKFAEEDTTNSFIPKLWATRRVGWLLDQIRMHGESLELKDEVTRLARQYGIVTPYTAYLILEDERVRHVPIGLQTMRELSEDRQAMSESLLRLDQVRVEAQQAQRRTGAAAVGAAQDTAQLKSSYNLAQASAAPGQAALAKSQASGGIAGYRTAQNYAQQARTINGRTFYQNGPNWTDSTAQLHKNLKTQQIAFGSPEYFDLLKSHPQAAQWLALGNNIDLVIDQTLYQIR